MKSVTGQDLYSVEYKENLMQSYSKFYRGLKDYKHDEYLDLIWLPDPKDVFKYDKKNPMHPLLFTKLVQQTEVDKDEAEMEHYRNLHKYDKKITDNELKYWEAHYKIRDLERKQVWDKTEELKNEINENKNLLEIYSNKDETPTEKRNYEDTTVI